MSHPCITAAPYEQACRYRRGSWAHILSNLFNCQTGYLRLPSKPSPSTPFSSYPDHLSFPPDNGLTQFVRELCSWNIFSPLVSHTPPELTTSSTPTKPHSTSQPPLFFHPTSHLSLWPLPLLIYGSPGWERNLWPLVRCEDLAGVCLLPFSQPLVRLPRLPLLACSAGPPCNGMI